LVRRLLSGPLPLRPGELSFTIYLVQVLVLLFIQRFIGPRRFHGTLLGALEIGI
jgi:peptidoglycan/LPS O-acetylase OafA/YrhL